MVIGIDFDNTIVNYGSLFLEAAIELDLIPQDFQGEKTSVRDYLRSHGFADADWQRVQAEVYGRRIAKAPPFEGVREFLELCRSRDVRTFIVSHKSRYAPADPRRIDLRDAARAWLARYDVRVDDVYFESSRAEKLARIATLGCAHFVDDLDEVFFEPNFPAGVERWLFAPGRSPISPFRAVQSWHDLAGEFFGLPAR
ncbi:MAG: hypothetical protein JO092_08720 [Candidatus Eremiobacteraeota bacterium]|nr:hypothetical protein [Candidatus Eremiobacteraeota bacterium]